MLVPCPHCRRHLRPTEDSCPFCQEQLNGSELRAQLATRPGPLPSGLKRALVYAIGTGVLSLVACEENRESAQPGEPRVSGSSEHEELPPTEPYLEYELHWRSLTDKELCALIHPAPCPPPEAQTPGDKPARIKAPKQVCNIDPNGDPLYGACF